MKIIFSRKGFDSSCGGIPNAILPDGRFCWFPIPDANAKDRYIDISYGEIDIRNLLRDLSKSKINALSGCHIDPDIQASFLPRLKGWKPCFGQAGAAQTHLERNEVGEGDLFLFFGWFRQIVQDRTGKWNYHYNSPDIHAIFGWLQIGQIFYVTNELMQIPEPWRQHPHVKGHKRYLEKEKINVIYIARKRLSLPGMKRVLPGGGSFHLYRESLRLTAPNSTRGRWLLPKWLYPREGRPALTFHGDLRRWQMIKDGIILQTVGRGQEFVIDSDYYPESLAWIKDLFRSSEPCP